MQSCKRKHSPDEPRSEKYYKIETTPNRNIGSSIANSPCHLRMVEAALCHYCANGYVISFDMHHEDCWKAVWSIYLAENRLAANCKPLLKSKLC